jgi:hypothetical protein
MTNPITQLLTMNSQAKQREMVTIPHQTSTELLGTP